MVLTQSKPAKNGFVAKSKNTSMVQLSKKRAMESDDEDSSLDEQEAAKMPRLSKKIKSVVEQEDSEDSDNDFDDSDEEDDDEQGSEEEDDDDGSEDEEDNESDEEVPPLKNTVNKRIAETKGSEVKVKSQTSMDKKPVSHVTASDVVEIQNSTGLIVTNFHRSTMPGSLKSYLSSKAGVNDFELIVNNNPHAVIVAKSKGDAEKLSLACQSGLFEGSNLHCASISTGKMKKQGVQAPRKAPEDVEPSNTILILPMSGRISKKTVEAICPKAHSVEQSNRGVYVHFKELSFAKETFVNIQKHRTIDGSTFFVKYVRTPFSHQEHTGTETRFNIYNLKFGTTEKEVKELCPKATFVHFNPSSIGSFIVEFDQAKDCKEAGSRVNNYVLQGRTLRVVFQRNSMWELKFTAKSPITDAKMMFNNVFTEMIDFRVSSVTPGNSKFKKPSFIILFEKKEAWSRALKKASEVKSIGGVPVTLCNTGSEIKKSVSAPVPAKKQKTVSELDGKKKLGDVSSKVKQPGSSDEEDDQQMDVNESSEDSDEDADDGSEKEESEEEEYEKPQQEPTKKPPFKNNKNFNNNNKNHNPSGKNRQNFGNRGGKNFNQRGGRGGKFRGRGK